MDTCLGCMDSCRNLTLTWHSYDGCWFLDQFWDGFMLCFWHVWCHVCGMFCGLNWEDIVVGGQGLFRDGFGSKIGVYQSCQGALWHASAWKPRYCVAGIKFATLGYAIAWVSTQLRSPCTLSNLKFRTAITPSSELCFWCS